MQPTALPISKASLKRTYPELDLAESPNPRIDQEGPTLLIDCKDGVAVIGLTANEAMGLIDIVLQREGL